MSWRAVLVEQAEGALLLFGFGFGLRGLGSGFASSRGGSSGRSSSGKSAGVLENSLDLSGLREVVLGGDGNGEQVLEGIGKDVGEGRLVGDAGCETNGGHVLDGCAENVADVGGGDVQDGGGQDGAVIVHLADDKTVREGADVELVEQSNLRGAALEALRQDGHVIHNLYCTLVDLGGDLQRLEERGLRGLKTKTLRVLRCPETGAAQATTAGRIPAPSAAQIVPASLREPQQRRSRRASEWVLRLMLVYGVIIRWKEDNSDDNSVGHFVVAPIFKQ